MTRPNDATLAQIAAADPTVSTWLSANAGSGKTRVLTDRVARLLLDGVSPEHILCLTYTKAAASEMQNRLFKRLGEWAMMDDGRLREALVDLGVEGPFPTSRLSRARTLFALAIETPGGLRIQTIHSFCASLLRRFPLEAGVSPQFTEIEDRAAALLHAEIADRMAEGPEAGLFAGFARVIGGLELDKVLREIYGNAGAFATELDEAEAFRLFDLPPGMTEARLEAQVFDGTEADLAAALIPVLRTGGTNDNKLADRLAGIRSWDYGALPVLEQSLLFGDGAKNPFSAKIGSVPTKPLREGAAAPFLPALNDLMQRVEEARPVRIALTTARRMLALHRFGRAFLGHYEAAKQARGWLDFDDLIGKAGQLLSDRRFAQWVLWRIDGGIDHILVDEAQDTSPAQWKVVELLAQEFTAGEGARADTPRTLFVVGDKKQSIYSFQGADAQAFDAMYDTFRARFDAARLPMHGRELAYSFRSSSAILRQVDQTFADHAASGFAASAAHRAFKEAMPGRVDLWPHVPKVESGEQTAWDDPVDRVADTHHTVVLANRIATEMRRMIDTRAPLPEEFPARSGQFRMRPVRAGDFLILVQSRSPLFHEIIRACKVQNLPIAGADRLKIGGELAVKDLGALLSFLATPEDSLSLATVLRSPLCGWSEQELFSLAHGRGDRHLWQVLRDRADDHAATLAMLDDLRREADFLRPFELIDRALTRHQGRKRFLERLGTEAEDGIDALLSQALAFERGNVPSLTGFLQWMQTDEPEIKRQLDSAGNRIRVMTVHGAKGLESPIVILPDCAKRPDQLKRNMVPVGPFVAWKGAAGDQPDALRQAAEAALTAERRERDRLLYVAMTRAESWLIVAAAGDLGKDETSWYERVAEGMAGTGATRHDFGFGPGLRAEVGVWGAADGDGTPPPDAPPVEVPGWVTRPVDTVPPRPGTLAPSDLPGPKALPGEGRDEEAAKRRGAQVHLLLEHLPAVAPDRWAATAARLLGAGSLRADPAELAALLGEARAVLTHPDLSPLFASGLAEATISAPLPDGRRLHGKIDRLILSETEVRLIDFKTNTVVPARPEDTPSGVLAQMGAYVRALEALYPGRTIRTGILWTATPILMDLPHDLVTQSFADTTSA